MASVGEVMTDATDLYAELNTAFAAAPIVIEVPDGLVVEAPIVIASFTATNGIVTLPRLVVRAGADSQLTVLDHHSSADVEALTLPVAEMDVGTGGVLRYLAVNQLGHRVWQIASQVARAAARLVHAPRQRGAGRRLCAGPHRRPTRGPGRVGQSARRYFGEAQQMHDFRTLQDHAAPKTTSDLLFKGAVGDARVGVQRAHPRAERSAGHDGLPDESQPQAERRCVGRLGSEPRDRHERRALQPRVSGRSRRLRAALLSREPRRAPERAEELIVNGFFSEVLERLPVPDLAGPLRAQIALKLSRRDVV